MKKSVYCQIVTLNLGANIANTQLSLESLYANFLALRSVINDSPGQHFAAAAIHRQFWHCADESARHKAQHQHIAYAYTQLSPESLSGNFWHCRV